MAGDGLKDSEPAEARKPGKPLGDVQPGEALKPIRPLDDDARAELDALLAKHELSDAVVRSLVALTTSLKGDRWFPGKWRRDLVPIIGDTLDALRHEMFTAAAEVIDIGSNGVTGLALAAALPEARITILLPGQESLEIFRRATNATGSANVDLVPASLEAWAAEHPDSFDLVVARDVWPARAGDGAAMLLRMGGHAVFWQGEKPRIAGDIEFDDPRMRFCLLEPGSTDTSRSEAQIFAYERVSSEEHAPSVRAELDLDAENPEQQVHLDAGGHRSREDGMCAAEAVAWLAREPHSDRPGTLSPALTTFLRSLNDNLNSAERQRLRPYLPQCVGTAGDGRDDARSWVAADWLIRTAAPTWLELGGMDAQAAALRGLPAIAGPDELAGARPVTSAARNEAIAARAAIYERLLAAVTEASDDPDHYRASAGDAARASAAVFAASAADGAAHATAAAAAEAAAYTAVDTAAYGVALTTYADRDSIAAVRKAAEGALGPTSVALQLSALELLDNLIDPPVLTTS
jgi:hypothetical protein